MWRNMVLFLLGAPNIGRRSLKTRLLSEYSTRFGEVRARKYVLLCIHIFKGGMQIVSF